MRATIFHCAKRGDDAVVSVFFFNDTATTEIYTLSLHDALPISDRVAIPTERELFLFGKTASTPKRGAAGEVARQDFNGSYGYVMD